MARVLLPTPFLPPAASCPAESSLHDPARLAALERTGLLDSPAEEVFDKLTRATQEILQVPLALVSLLTSDRQFFKSAVGLPEPWASLRQTPLSHSFCRIVAAGAETLAIRDARKDERVKDNETARDLGVVAYLGVPLTVGTERHTLGAFCAIDTQPRSWSKADVKSLMDLSAAAITEIERRSSDSTEVPTTDANGMPPENAISVGDMATWLARRRRARGLSLGALALKSGVNKSSLSRWESGSRGRPHVPELEAVMEALGVGLPERIEVYSALGNAAEVRRLWEQAWREDIPANTVSPAGSDRLAPSLPMPGDVLRQMRLRQGWSQAQLATNLRASQGSVAKWEASDDWPDMERTLALCVALNASGREADLLLGWCAARTQGWRLPHSPE